MREGLEKELIDSVCKEIYEAIESAKEKSAEELELKDGTIVMVDGDWMVIHDGKQYSLDDCVQCLALDVIEHYKAIESGRITKEESKIKFKIFVLDSVSNALAATKKS